jgi:type VI protein secretion system component Hcp
MATAKKAKKSTKHLSKARKLEAQKPLTKVAASAPTETVTLPYGKIEWTYTQQNR